ncbi:ABC transporter ATP-binding protein [Helcococcus ovis]|uniref:ABC transporter ATP-binding protein n=1 Tax=Helcococcus ovis TaxID=72026 RepID=A0A4R9C3D5_9FIRM|nr:ABC transporter ATP-binding protein [Helcococcus ovis]TFF65896.1 ABC transporter ATP-binding protein [Helcococcus ovis]TFF67359.1 ABC transporter ATP-binding protein [Helcococcus ovis]TFF67582.1 ABC transporter ATP-binding protein [Helcococcus ovis]WNZ00998.1 ABC transporter ATP-binding protein [Helcococcus ovis]
MSILKLENVTKKFGKQEVLKGINMHIEKPGIYAVIGPNGAGKSTLFNVISNLLKANSGEIEVVGKKNTNSDIFFEVSFLKDNRVLYDYLTGYDHLAFIKTAQKLPKERIDEVVEKLQIAHYMNKKTGDYSLGMKQHLLIAMAMMNKPKLMILDEPLNGLDPTSVIKVRHLLKELVESGTAILISSHTLSEIDLLTDQIMFLKDGRIVEEQMDLIKDNIYELSLTKESVEKLKDYQIKGLNYELNQDKMIANIGINKVSYLIEKLEDENIEFTDITKKKVGSEERYMKMFPEEMEKIRK